MCRAWVFIDGTVVAVSLVLVATGCNRQKEPLTSVAERPATSGEEVTSDAPAPTADQPSVVEVEAADSPEARAEMKSAADAPPGSQEVSSPDEIAAGQPRRAEQFERLDPPDQAMFPNLRSLSPEHDVWIDPENKRVVLRGGVCLREGPVELFACIHQWVDDKFAEGGKSRRGTKEYESLVTVNTTATLVHTALLAVGAKEGDPVQFAPEYKTASGSEIEIALHWTDENGSPKEARAQQWLRNTKTGQAMTHPWVFAGSGFFEDEQTKERRYLGEEGNLICVSNFTDAVLDVPVPSTAANSALLFEAFTENMPPLGTPVTIVLTPKANESESSESRPKEPERTE